MLLIIISLVLYNSPVFGAQLTPTFPEIEAQKILAQVVDGTNSFDEQKILSAIDPDASMISKNGEVVLDKAGIAEYFSRMVKGKAILKKMTSVARFQFKPIIEGNTLIWLGDSDDHYEFSSGLDLKIKTVFTSVFSKTSDGWKIKHIHFGFNVWDYPLLTTANFSVIWAPICAFLGCLLVTVLFLFLRQKRRLKKAVLTGLIGFMLLSSPGNESYADVGVAPFDYKAALLKFWQDPAHGQIRPDFVSISNAGEMTQGFNDYLRVIDYHRRDNHRPTDTVLSNISKTAVSAESALVIGTVNEVFRGSPGLSRINFKDRFTALFLKSSSTSEWLLAAYQTSSDLFDNTNLRSVARTLWMLTSAAALLGVLLGRTLFRKFLIKDVLA